MSVILGTPNKTRFSPAKCKASQPSTRSNVGHTGSKEDYMESSELGQS